MEKLEIYTLEEALKNKFDEDMFQLTKDAHCLYMKIKEKYKNNILCDYETISESAFLIYKSAMGLWTHIGTAEYQKDKNRMILGYYFSYKDSNAMFMAIWNLQEYITDKEELVELDTLKKKVSEISWLLEDILKMCIPSFDDNETYVKFFEIIQKNKEIKNNEI